MNPGSWSSFQSALPPEARAGGEPDDDPPAVTVPAVPTPNKRYMQRVTPWSWDVYSWQTRACNCLGTTRAEHGEPLPDPACKVCGGTGDDGCPEPFREVCDLDEADARLLVFGWDLFHAATAVIEAVAGPMPVEPQNIAHLLHGAVEQIRPVVDKAGD